MGLIRNRIEKLTFAGEHAVIEDQRNFRLALGEMEGVFDVIADEKCSQQASIDVEPVDAHGMVVVPEHCCVLLVGVIVESGLPRHEPILRITVTFGRNLGTVQMDRGTDRRLIGFGAVEIVVDGQEMFAGQLIRPFHPYSFPAAGFQGRAGCG